MALLTADAPVMLNFPPCSPWRCKYDYVKNAFNAHAAFVTGWRVFLSGILAATTVALGFGGYFMALTGVCPVRVSAFLLLLALTVILALGIRETVRVAVVLSNHRGSVPPDRYRSTGTLSRSRSRCVLRLS